MIWLVGAGPGDSGLLTLRGYEVLKRADVVIYDRLVSEAILAMIPEDAELIDAGKSPGNHTLSQREIEAVMIDRAREGKNVVRLKGGDPFIFGRGGEETEAIIAAGLAFEVVPGVSSAVSVPAYAGIPATHRDYCSGVSIFTAHDKDNLLPDFSDTTSIFLMGIAHAKELQEKLLLTLSPETPCAVIQDGTTARQRIIRTKLASLHEAVIKNGITPPAVIVAGNVAGLSLDWRSNLPLNGKRVIITRPHGRGESLASRLRDLGAEVIHLPAIRTETLHGALDGVSLGGYDWAGFTSVTGAESFFGLLAESGRDVRELGSARIAAIGRTTAESLSAHGLRVDYVPEIYDGVHLAEGIAQSGGRVLMFRALDGSQDISQTFRNYGIESVQVYIYRIDYVKLVHVPNYTDIIIFTSSSTVRGFCQSVNTMRDVKAVCIGSQTAREAVRQGFSDVVIAEQADIDSLVKAVLSCS
ncbi:MAG: uroporphyrinogen-III C-methyltransferase [Synergistaceae bacterium]|nr:uroporphyrinogen-III C-methyltransferase [Synergistaceae bacterium]